MAFLEVVFPTNISYGAQGGASWSTRIVVTDSGREYRQQMWDRTRGRWTVGHNLRTPTEWDALLSFHRLAQGRTFGFRFRDWTDFQDSGRGILAVNTAGHYQLAKYYQATNVVTSATITAARLITKPEPGTIAFFLNAAPATPTLDYTTGVVTGPGTVTGWTWTGNFHVPARFDTDEPELSYDTFNAVGWRGIPIVEVRVEDA